KGSSVCLPRPIESVAQIPAKPSFSTVVPNRVSHCRPEPGCSSAGGRAISAKPARMEILFPRIRNEHADGAVLPRRDEELSVAGLADEEIRARDLRAHFPVDEIL